MLVDLRVSGWPTISDKGYRVYFMWLEHGGKEGRRSSIFMGCGSRWRRGYYSRRRGMYTDVD